MTPQLSVESHFQAISKPFPSHFKAISKPFQSHLEFLIFCNAFQAIPATVLRLVRA